MAAQPIFFTWKDSFSLGIPAVDAEHQQFFEIMNRCAKVASQGATPTEVQLVLKELATYARTHFEHEEAALDRVGYPEVALQRAEHQRFTKELERIQALETPSILAALSLTRDWLMQHVMGSDRRYVAWITKDRGAYTG